MSLLSLFLPSLFIILFVRAQPLDAHSRRDIQRNLSIENVVTHPMILGDLAGQAPRNHHGEDAASRPIVANVSKTIVGTIKWDDDVISPTIGNWTSNNTQCVHPSTGLQTGTPILQGRFRNSTAGCGSSAVSSATAAQISSLFHNVSVPSGGSGRLLYPVMKVGKNELVPADESVQKHDIPSVDTAQMPGLPSESQQVQTLVPVAAVKSLPLLTPLSTLESLGSSPESASSVATAGQTGKIGAPNNIIFSGLSSTAATKKNAEVEATIQEPTLPTPASKLAPLEFGGSSYIGNTASGFTIAGQPLRPGSQITVSGTPISLVADGASAVIGGSAQILAPLSTPAQPTVTPHLAALLTIAGATYTADSSSDFRINGKTLRPGDVITAGGTTVSLDQKGTAAIIDGSSTQMLSYARITEGPTPTFMLNGSKVAQDAASEFVIDGQTLSMGGVVIVSGTPISLAADGTDVVVGTSTQALVAGDDLGNGIGAPTTSIETFQSGARGRCRLRKRYLGAGAGLWVFWKFLADI